MSDLTNDSATGTTSSHEADTIHIPAAPPTAATEALVAGAVGDRCVNCGTALTSDQRYCVVCGERRGASRFALPSAVADAEQSQPATTIVRERRGPFAATGIGVGTTLIAGVATLLLAMLVGVLIGHNTAHTTTQAAAPAQVITVNGGGSSNLGASSSGSGSSAGSGTTKSSTKQKKFFGQKSKSKSSSTAAKAKTAAAQKKAQAKAAAAANKVTGAKNSAPATVTVGSKCSGSECNKAGFNKKTHKFDGSFFGQ